MAFQFGDLMVILTLFLLLMCLAGCIGASLENATIKQKGKFTAFFQRQELINGEWIGVGRTKQRQVDDENDTKKFISDVFRQSKNAYKKKNAYLTCETDERPPSPLIKRTFFDQNIDAIASQLFITKETFIIDEFTSYTERYKFVLSHN